MGNLSDRIRHINRILGCILCLFVFVNVNGQDAKKEPRYQPVIEGDWWSITSQPDMGELSSDKQQPVDFAVWQADDGTWQLWACVRGLKGGGKGRAFYRWEAQKITDTAWKPMGIAMQADTTIGEEKAGLQAPYVFKDKGKYFMVYGDWNNICLAESEDGKNFKRVINHRKSAALFSGPKYNTRDAMVLKVGSVYYCYYTAHNEKDDKSGQAQAAVYCRASKDLVGWSDAKVVSQGGSALRLTQWFGGDAECPFVMMYKGKFILFRNQKYGANAHNTQYCSDSPLDFGIDKDEYLVSNLPVAAPEIVYYRNQYYIVSLKPGLDGMKIAKLKFESVKH